MWQIEYDSAVPPLPIPVTPPARRSTSRTLDPIRVLKEGCWMLQLNPAFDQDMKREPGWLAQYQGTLRIEHIRLGGARRKSVIASGDLYLKKQPWYEKEKTPPYLSLDEPHRIPSFPRDEYRYYLRLLGFEKGVARARELTATIATFRLDGDSGEWSEAGVLTATLAVPKQCPREWAEGYLEGTVRNEARSLVGTVALGWICDKLRRATIEIDHVAGVKLPLDNGGKYYTMKRVFAAVKWDVALPKQPFDIEEPEGGVWNEKLLHEEMLRWRGGPGVDEEWRYHVLVVKRLQQDPTYGFGRMYDAGAIDSNLVPREGVAIAAHGKFPSRRIFGKAAKKKLEDVPEAFFRTVVHELAHAMGLTHNFMSRGFLQNTILLAEDLHGKFPHGIEYAFHPTDQTRLKHFPDAWVRPGGLPFRFNFSRSVAPIEDVTSSGDRWFDFQVRAVTSVLPLGAPLRLYLRLTNTSDRSLPGPISLGLSDGSVSGWIIDPSGNARSFVTAKFLEGTRSGRLRAGASLDDGVTLLRGPDGPLLPGSGRYVVRVQAVWRGPGGLVRVENRTEILVREPKDEEAEAVLRILSSPELTVPLLFRSSPELDDVSKEDLSEIKSGLEILDLALTVPSLAPHFAAIRARWLADQGSNNLAEVTRWIKDSTLLSSAEVANFLDLLSRAKPFPRPRSSANRIRAVLRVKAKELLGDDLASPELHQRAMSIHF